MEAPADLKVISSSMGVLTFHAVPVEAFTEIVDKIRRA
jgi:hypothetical protein